MLLRITRFAENAFKIAWYARLPVNACLCVGWFNLQGTGHFFETLSVCIVPGTDHS